VSDKKEFIPKLGRPINAKFMSLRNGIGASMGVIFGIDTEVKRKVRRVLCEGGWKFQIVNLHEIVGYDWSAETDQVILDEIGMDLSLIEFEAQ